MNGYLKAWKNFANFNGRTSRGDYWSFVGMNIVVLLLLGVIDYAIFGAPGIFYGLYALATLVPSLSAAVRRMHDIDKGGAWILISLVPAIGGIWFLVLTLTQGTDGPNQFGNPDGVENDEMISDEVIDA